MGGIAVGAGGIGLRSALALVRLTCLLASALDKLLSLGTAELASDKPRSYRLAPAPGRDRGDGAHALAVILSETVPSVGPQPTAKTSPMAASRGPGDALTDYSCGPHAGAVPKSCVWLDLLVYARRSC